MWPAPLPSPLPAAATLSPHLFFILVSHFQVTQRQESPPCPPNPKEYFEGSRQTNFPVNSCVTIHTQLRIDSGKPGQYIIPNSQPIIPPVLLTDNIKNAVSIMAWLLLPQLSGGPRLTGVQPRPAAVSSDVSKKCHRGRAGCVSCLTNGLLKPIIYFLYQSFEVQLLPTCNESGVEFSAPPAP